jgi:uncharacterized coiled-coil protein SlyX
MSTVNMELVAWLRDELKEQKQTVEKLSEDVANQSQTVRKLQENLTMDYGAAQKIRALGAHAAINALGGKGSSAYRAMSMKVFGKMWSDYKKYFGVPSYRDTKVKDYDRAVEYLKRWHPPTEMEIEIDELNRQIKMEV